jgi:hypothetical protein
VFYTQKCRIINNSENLFLAVLENSHQFWPRLYVQFSTLFNTASSAVPQISLCRRMLELTSLISFSLLCWPASELQSLACIFACTCFSNLRKTLTDSEICNIDNSAACIGVHREGLFLMLNIEFLLDF